MKQINKWVVMIAVAVIILLHYIVITQKSPSMPSAGLPDKLQIGPAFVDLLSPVSIALSTR